VNRTSEPRCLVISPAADEFAAEIARLAPLPVTACSSVEQARDVYTDEPILFGSPGMIADILPEMPTVEWVQSSWAGVTPLIALARRNYVLTAVKDVFGPQMSEYVIGFLLAHELKVCERMRRQRQHEWFTEHSGMLSGKHLGILGTGSIGRHIAATARAFDMTVTGLSRSGAALREFDAVLPSAALHRFLEPLDYLVSALPQTRATDRLLDSRALASLPPHAVFVNVGRGNVVDEAALVEALRNHGLAAAVLDVFAEEPLPPHSALWDAPRLSITAHIAAVSHPWLIVPIFVENYRRFRRGDPLRYVVDFDAGY